MATFKMRSEVEAVHWLGRNIDEVDRFMSVGDEIRAGRYGSELLVPTPNGPVLAKLGEWVVKGIDGNLRVYSHPEFARTFIDQDGQVPSPNA